MHMRIGKYKQGGEDVEGVVEVLKALSDETRLRIINLLYEKSELCVCDIIEALEITQTKASRHLSYLKNAGMVTSRRSAQWVYYSLSIDNSMNFIHTLVFENLRKEKQFQQDLKNLDSWLKTKTISC